MIRKKVKSEEGASLMLALLFFVICAMVASVILVSATGAAGRVAKLDEYDKNKYALESAASVLKAELKGTTARLYTVTDSGTVYKVKNADGTYANAADQTEPFWVADNDDNSATVFPFEGLLRALLNRKTPEYTLSVPDMPDVTMKAALINPDATLINPEEEELKDRGSIIITLRIKDAGENSPEMVLTLPADYQKHDETKNGETVHVTEVAYRSCVSVLNDWEYDITPTP